MCFACLTWSGQLWSGNKLYWSWMVGLVKPRHPAFEEMIHWWWVAGELARGVMMDPNHFLPCFPPRLTMLTLPWQLLPLLWSAPRPTPRAPCPLLPMPTIHSPPVVVLPSDHPLSCAPSSYLYCWDPIEIVFDWLISIFKSCIFSIKPTLKVDDPMWGCVAERNWTLSQHDQVNNLSPLSSNT